MFDAGDRYRLGRYKCLTTPAVPRVWQLPDSEDRSPFFFAWGDPMAVDLGRTENELGLARDRDFSGRSRPDRGLSGNLHNRRFDVRALLDSHPIGGGAARDEDDDSSLSVCVSSLFDRNRRESDPGRYVETTQVPFLTLSVRETFRPTGVALGDLATVVSTRTGRVAHAIVGDSAHVPGAATSVLLAETLGLAYGDVAVFLIHPGSGQGQGIIPTNAQIYRRSERLFRLLPSCGTLTWTDILADCFGDIFLARRRRDRSGKRS